MIKNTASQKIGVQMVSATDGSAFTSAVTAYITLDAGAQAQGTVGSGACTHEGNGYHTYAPSQAETNGDLVAVTFTGTGAIPVTVQIYTVAGDSFTRLGAPAGASVSADIAALQTSVTTIDDFLDTEIAAILAAVDTEVAAILALLDDARTEPGQGAPPVNPDLATKVDYLYKAWRNKKDNDGAETKLYADNGTTVDHKQSTTESGGTVTKAEWITGA